MGLGKSSLIIEMIKKLAKKSKDVEEKKEKSLENKGTIIIWISGLLDKKT